MTQKEVCTERLLEVISVGIQVACYLEENPQVHTSSYFEGAKNLKARESKVDLERIDANDLGMGGSMNRSVNFLFKCWSFVLVHGVVGC